jgi:hypothetical protein
MVRKVRAHLSFANVLASIALFVTLGGTSYAVATGSIDSREIRNNTVRGKDIRTGNVASRDLRNDDVRSRDIENTQVRNVDLNAEVAVAKGFASIQATNANGPANVLNSGGQQTNGVTAQRVGTGIYDVTFTGTFTNVDNVADLAHQVTGRNGFSTGSVFDAASTANANQIKLRVFMRRPDNGAGIDSAFSVQFYAQTTQ